MLCVEKKNLIVYTLKITIHSKKHANIQISEVENQLFQKFWRAGDIQLGQNFYLLGQYWAVFAKYLPLLSGTGRTLITAFKASHNRIKLPRSSSMGSSSCKCYSDISSTNFGAVSFLFSLFCIFSVTKHHKSKTW